MDSVGKQEFRDLDREVGQMGREVATLKTQIMHLNGTIAQLVTKAEFLPVKVIVYGLAAGTMGAVMTAVISSVVQ